MEGSSGMPPPRLIALLEPEERLLWWGIPKQGLMLRSTDIHIIPFSMVYAGLMFIWEGLLIWAILNKEDWVPPLIMALFGIPLFLTGLYLLLGRFFHDAWRRSRTVYGLTAGRILIARPPRLRSIDLATLDEIELSEASDNTGTIEFGAAAYGYWQWNGDGWSFFPAFEPRALEGISNPRGVFAAIRTAQKQAQRSAPHTKPA